MVEDKRQDTVLWGYKFSDPLTYIRATATGLIIEENQNEPVRQRSFANALGNYLG